MENTFNSVGDVTRSVFRCREFSCWRDVAQYLETGAKTYKDTVFIHDGNIFDCFDSFNYFSDFCRRRCRFQISALPLQSRGRRLP